MSAVHVIIVRKKTQIFLDVTKDTQVLDVKRMIGGILKVTPANMRLFYKSQSNELQDDKFLKDYNINSSKPHDPVFLALVLRTPDSTGWEKLEITPLSKPVY